jgi:hypothetical protein
MNIEQAVKDLAEAIGPIVEGTQDHQGQLAVVACALAALIKSHPDPEAFASAFRRSWLQLGAPNSDDHADPAFASGIDSMLSIAEEHCRVPLNVRNPDSSTPPER